MSTSELELDAVAADIINHQDLTGAAMNPGLVALWDDERIRREKVGMDDPLSPPPSPPRPAKAPNSKSQNCPNRPIPSDQKWDSVVSKKAFFAMIFTFLYCI